MSERPETYVVESGDTLSGIAQRFYDDANLYTLIAEANGIDNPNLIFAGQELSLPMTADEQEAAEAAEATAAAAAEQDAANAAAAAAAAEQQAQALRAQAEVDAAKAAADAAEGAKQAEEDKAYDDMMAQAKINAAESVAALKAREMADDIAKQMGQGS